MRHTILAALLAATSAPAQIINGDFETGTLAGWTVELGEHSAISPAGCGGIDFSSAGTSPIPGASIYTSSTPLPFVDPDALPDPWGGSNMALLNDPDGSFHACRLSQTFTITLENLNSGGLLGLEWGAVLEDPNHTGGCQPWFSVEVLGCGIHEELFVDATDAANDGWVDISLPSISTPFYYWHDVWCVDVSSCTVGSQVTVRVTVADCAFGAHGGCAFLDNVRFLKCTPTPDGMVAWWRDDSGQDTALTNDFEKIGTWFSQIPSAKVGSDSALVFSNDNYGIVNFDEPCHTPSFHFAQDQGFACDMWVRPSSAGPFYAPLINKIFHHVGLWSYVYDFHLEDRYLALTLKTGFDDEFSNYVCTDARVPAGDWTHIAFSADRAATPSEVRFYINGELRDVFPTDPDPFGNDQNGALEPYAMFIGHSMVPYDNLVGPGVLGPVASYFRGLMDEIEFFNRALTSAEVYAIFASGCRGKCVPRTFTDYVRGLPGIGSTPPLPAGTFGTDTPVGCCNVLAVHAPPGQPGTTSTWDGHEWTEHGVTGPSGIHGAMTFDTVRNVAVAIGGNAVSGATEVWEWIPGPAGGTWTLASALGGPPALTGHAIAYDATRRCTFVFGGQTAGVGVSDQTWSWDGNVWTRVTAGQSPTARSQHTMAYDLARGEILMFGGLDSNGGALGDTWTFDGTSWSAVQPSPSPSARFAHAMAYDRARDRTIVYGGTDSQSDRSDTWEWDGTDWALQTVINEPPARHDAMLVFDASRDKCVVMSGSSGYDGMWYYGSMSPAWRRTFGEGCPGVSGAPAPTLEPAGRAWLGGQHEVVASQLPASGLAFFALGFTNTDSPIGPLPINLAILGLHPTCELLTEPVVSLSRQVSSGAASLQVNLPSDPVLLSLAYYVQVIAADPVTTEIVLTNGVEFSIGRR